MRNDVRGAIVCVVDEPVIYRQEIVALQFTLNDIARTLVRIERLLGGDDGDEEADES